MKLERQGRDWRSIERRVLWTILAVGTLVAIRPLAQDLQAWRSQSLLQAQWKEAVRLAKMRHRPKAAKHFVPVRAASPSKLTTSGKTPSHSQPVPHAVISPSPTPESELLSWPHPKQGESKNSQEALDPLWPLVRLSCSKINLDSIVVEGTGVDQLKCGPGHEVGTSWPGEQNCVIAAHRNAYGWWFYHLDSLKRDDPIILQTPGWKYTYRVVTSHIVSVRDTSILHCQAQDAPRLTLYTCTLPKTQQRLVVVANLQKSEMTW